MFMIDRDMGAPRPTRRLLILSGAATLAAPSLARAQGTLSGPPDPARRALAGGRVGGCAAPLDRGISPRARSASRWSSRTGRARAARSGRCRWRSNPRPDGYTLTQMHLSVLRRPWMMRTPQWDPIADFTHIIGMTGWLFGCAVKADSPFQTWQQMIAYARANPGKLNYTTSGIGTTNHLAMETIQEKENVQLTHVPFRGSNEAVTAVLGGQVEMVCDSSTWAPFVENGQMRCLSVWTAERVPRFPNVPTLKELGYDLTVTSPYGVSGPKGMDEGVVRVLHDVMKTAR
jgi:hypothetical protein